MRLLCGGRTPTRGGSSRGGALDPGYLFSAFTLTSGQRLGVFTHGLLFSLLAARGQLCFFVGCEDVHEPLDGAWASPLQQERQREREWQAADPA